MSGSPFLRFVALSVALLVPVVAAAQSANDEDLLAKLRTLLKDKSAKQKIEKIVCEYDGACLRRLSSSAMRAQAKAAMPKKPPASFDDDADYKIYTTVLLRDVYSPVAFITADSDVSQKGATFSVTDNLQDRKTTVIGKGALMLAAYGNVDTNKSAFPIGYFAVTPGVEWNRKVINGVDTGTMSGKFGGEVEIVSGLFNHYVRTGAVYTTDVKTEANLFGFETGWQPANTQLWWNVRKRLWLDSPVWFGFYPALNANYYRSKAIGELASLKPDHSYFWVGPSAAASISFDKGTPFENLSFDAKYFYFYDAYDPAESTVNYLEVGMQYSLVKFPGSPVANSGKIALDIHYTSGRAPQTLERVAEWYAGLNLKLGDIAP